MLLAKHLALFFLCCFLSAQAAAQEVTTREDASPRLVRDLSSKLAWQMEGIRPGQGEREGFHEHFGEIASGTYNWNGGSVPGDVYTDLWKAGQIDDPHYGRNGMRAKWVLEREWWYRRQFAVDESWRGKTIRVVFEGVDYACDVWLNGKHLGRHEGMFSPFEFEVSSLLHYGGGERSNGLVIRLDPPPRNYRLVAGRKFAWHGDYWRTLTPIGIWKPVKLVATGGFQIQDVHPKSEIHDDGSAAVEVEVEVGSSGAAPVSQAQVSAVIEGKNFPSGNYETAVGGVDESGRASLSVKIPDAKLWWPMDLGDPNLYRVEVTVSDGSGQASDRTSTTFGIREIEMERNPGYTEEEVGYPWLMKINGKRVFLRSASWGGPPDIFYGRNSPEKYRKLVEMAKAANINNLRIFGWHPPEVKHFYELCDELGITVWQNLLPLASIRIPEDEAFRKATYAEAVSVMKQLRNHPSLVLLEGGEEMFYGTQGLAYNAEFLLGLEDAIRPYTDLPYVPTSPLEWPTVLRELGIGKSKDSGHTHKLFYAAGSEMLVDYVKSWDYAAIPEFGVTSAPSAESVRKFIPPEELWPPGPSWGYHWADLDILKALNFQIVGDESTGSLEEFVDATQVAQGTAFQYGLEHMRRRKPKSSAIAICHFITFAPDMKWGIVDYYQQPKKSYDYVKRAYQPVLISMEVDKRRWLEGETFNGDLWLVNDFHKGFADCKLEVEVLDGQGKRLASEAYAVESLAADSSTKQAEFSWPVAGVSSDGFRVAMRLLDADGKTLSANYYDFLIGDQELARKACAERAKAAQESAHRAQRADYYRYFPEVFEIDE